MSPDLITPLCILAAEIPIRSPNLEHLQLVENTAWQPAQKVLFKPGLSKLLYTLNLREFTCDFIELDDELIWCLLTMPSLIVLGISTDILTLKQNLLRHPLWCDTFKKGALVSVASLLHPDNMTALRITFTAPSSHPPVEELSGFLTIIGKQCSPSLLADLQLDTAASRHPAAAITFNVIGNLLPFSHLRDLNFSAHPFNLTNDEIKQLAKAWPLLETLCVNTDPLAGPPPQTSLNGLLWLATYCRQLKSLEFRFDETCGQVLPEEMGAAANHRLLFLSVGSSLIENPDKVAKFLACTFPGLSLLMFSHSSDDINHERWSEVQAQIQFA
ncbi:hypothetical protein CPB84DRAFT_956941 [Gymnopilus junonius]|uniref:Uncharacterized protein n=1 Tax=Gymnopilus junonius TaxID=109634 RepID=A0A9P5N9G8_GYMJU|nr:hypothetical protein CPB84DRAFT_956941 [Gymnopilus junonius]